MEPREIAIAQARGRIAVGAAYFLAPGLAGRTWVGGDAARPSAQLLARAFGARDLALGLGVEIAIDRAEPARLWLDLCVRIAIDRGAPLRVWLEASALSDAADAVATMLGASAVPALMRPGV